MDDFQKQSKKQFQVFIFSLIWVISAECSLIIENDNDNQDDKYNNTKIKQCAIAIPTTRKTTQQR